MRRVIRSGGVIENRSEVLDVFFGLKEGKLPEKLEKLHSEYLLQLNRKGGCSSCRKSAIKKRYRKLALELI